MDSSSRIVLDTTAAEVVPGETARYPFAVRTGGPLPPAAEFGVISDRAGFDPRWARVVRATDELRVTRYLLEITPSHVQRDQYGRYPLSIGWEAAESVTGHCELVIKPGVRLTGRPDLSTWPAGKLTLSIENFSHSDVDVDITLAHHGSSWSQGWEFELEAGAGPVTFTEQFDPPEGGRRGSFTLTVSAAGATLAEAQLSGRKLAFPRKAAVIAAVLAAGAALGAGGLAVAGLGGHPPGKPHQTTSPTKSVNQVRTLGSSPVQSVTSSGGGSSPTTPTSPTSPTKGSQAITFSSTPPASAAPDDTYLVTATGGASGQPVTFTIDASSAPVCSIADHIVTFNQEGHCLIDANQAGNDLYLAASQAQQPITVAKLPQKISFEPPATVQPGSSGVLIASSTSGDPVKLEIDTDDSTDTCTISGDSSPFKIQYGKLGYCVIDATQPGDNRYAAAPEVIKAVSTQNGLT